LQQRQEGTGLWFLRDQAFSDWKAQPNSFLWVYGIPGCGKTVLSATILEDLQHSPSSHHLLLYFFCDFSDASKQTLENIIRSLISQLYYKQEATQAPLNHLFSTHTQRKRTQPSCKELSSVFIQMIRHVPEVWIVLDAIDECITRKGSWTEGILSWMEYILQLEQGNIHLLITSRQEQDIQAKVSEWASSKNIVPIQSDVVDKDIRTYVQKRIREDYGLKRWRKQPKSQDKIEATLMNKVNGMYVQFHMYYVLCDLLSYIHAKRDMKMIGSDGLHVS
jgi:Cdc6-like AAA superfamily ATPase